MKTKRLNEDSELGAKIIAIEKMMDDAGIKIVGHDLRLSFDGHEYRIGRDCDQFPRFVEEPFWRYAE